MHAKDLIHGETESQSTIKDSLFITSASVYLLGSLFPMLWHPQWSLQFFRWKRLLKSVKIKYVLVPFLKIMLCFYKTTLRLRPDSHAERVAACRHESKHCQGVAQCDYILKIQYLILETARDI
jgi:hypothetical protein